MQLSVRRRLVALIVFAGLTALVGTLALRSNDEALQRSLRQADLRRTQDLIAAILRLSSARIDAVSSELTYWDELIAFTRTRDRRWADSALSSPLTSWDIDGVWVFDVRGEKIYSADRHGRRLPCPLSIERVKRVARPHSPPGECSALDATGLWDVHAGAIFSSTDPSRRGPSYGYLVHGRLLDAAYWQQLEKDAQCRVVLADPELPIDAPSQLVTSVVMRSWEGRPLRRADFYVGESSAAMVRVSSAAATLWAALLGIIICVTVGGGIYYWVYRPLGVLSAALREDRPENLAPLRGVRDEFGTLAQLIERSFEQRKTLRQEISERQVAETGRAQRDAIVSAIAFAAEELLMPGPWVERLVPAVARLGESVGASRMHVLQVFADPDDSVSYACVGDWTSQDWALERCVPGERRSFAEQGLGSWPERLRRGEIIYGPVRELPGEEAESIGRQGSLSIVSAPIFAGDTWWGFLGLDDCRVAREWSTAELDGLRMAARLIGAAVGREENDARIADMAQFESAIIDASPIGISVRDPHGRLLRHNEAWQRIWAMTDEDVAADMSRVRSTLQFDPTDSYLGAAAVDVERVYREGGTAYAEEVPTLGARPGAARWVSQRFYAIKGAAGNVDRVVVLTEDVSKRKEAEEESRRLVDELGRAAAELDERVQRRTADLLAANAELESFAYSVSHDLKAPLRAVDGFSQALLEDYSSALPPEGVRYAQLVRRAAREMGVLIERILELSRLSRVALRTEKVRLSDIAMASLVPFSDQIEADGVQIEIDETPECLVDAGLMQHVLTSLLSNALKYTRPVEHPRIRFSEHEGVYCVRDNGVGFPMENSGMLFAPFQRLHSASEFEGSGVGLAIVKRIISRHGGTIWAESEPNQGAAFYFTIDESVRRPDGTDPEQ